MAFLLAFKMEDNNIKEISTLASKIQDCFNDKKVITKDGKTEVVYPTSKVLSINEHLSEYNKDKKPEDQIPSTYLNSPSFWDTLYGF